jgi:RNA polymerase sigma factor (sigma-70 family)
MGADDLFQQHAPELSGYFHRRLGSPELAADLCQEVYLRLRRLEQAGGGAPLHYPLHNPRAFLFRIARNLLIDHLRQQHARPATVALHDPDLRLESDAPTPEAAASSAQTLAGVQAALTELPDHVRQALLWNRLEGLTQREIGTRLGVSERMAGKYISRALSHCRAWLAAAVLLLMVVVAAQLPWRVWGADQRTAAGEQRVLTLEDGSRVTLAGDSAIDLNLSDHQRRVTLLRGRAYFQVAKDPQRPFLVVAGEAKVRVTGTRFEVRRDEGERVRLTVAEGEVVASGVGRRLTLRAGEQVHWSRGRLGDPRRVDVAPVLAWLEGRLVFSDQPLRDILRELAPHHPDHLLLLDQTLAERRFSGTLNSGNPDAALSALSQTLPLTVRHLPGVVILY